MTAGAARARWAGVSGGRSADGPGYALSHAVGIALGSFFLLDRILNVSIWIFKPVDLGLYFCLLWMFLDRRGRDGVIRPRYWDWLFLGFIAVYAVAHIYAEAVQVRYGGFMNYVEWCVSMSRPFIAYLLTRELLRRRGARIDIVITWIVGMICVSALIGLMQATNVLGARRWSYLLFNQREAEKTMWGPSAPWQARGATVHANMLALQSWLSLSLIAGLIAFRGLRWWDVGGILLLLAALIATYSRAGVIVIVVMAGAFCLFLFARGLRTQAVLAAAVSAAAVILGIFAIFAFDVERLKPLVRAQGPVERPEELGSFRGRMILSVRAAEIASRNPIFGAGAVSAGINNPTRMTKTSYNFSGRLDNSYSYGFMMYGAPGVLYMAGALFGLLYAIRGTKRHLPFAVTSFLLGTGMGVHAMSENVFFIDAMLVVGMVAALVVDNVRARGPKPAALPESEVRQATPVVA